MVKRVASWWHVCGQNRSRYSEIGNYRIFDIWQMDASPWNNVFHLIWSYNFEHCLAESIAYNVHHYMPKSWIQLSLNFSLLLLIVKFSSQFLLVLIDAFIWCLSVLSVCRERATLSNITEAVQQTLIFGCSLYFLFISRMEVHSEKHFGHMNLIICFSCAYVIFLYIDDIFATGYYILSNQQLIRLSILKLCHFLCSNFYDKTLSK